MSHSSVTFPRRRGPRPVHGATGTRLYTLWNGFKCRGLLCREWASFPAFRDGVGPMPQPRAYLLRRDSSRPLGPGNFAWTNSRRGMSHRVAHPVASQLATDSAGQPLTMSQSAWSRRLGVSRECIRKVMERDGNLDSWIVSTGRLHLVTGGAK